MTDFPHSREIAINVEIRQSGLLIATSRDAPEFYFVENSWKRFNENLRACLLSWLSGRGRGTRVQLISSRNPEHPVFRVDQI